MEMFIIIHKMFHIDTLVLRPMAKMTHDSRWSWTNFTLIHFLTLYLSLAQTYINILICDMFTMHRHSYWHFILSPLIMGCYSALCTGLSQPHKKGRWYKVEIKAPQWASCHLTPTSTSHHYINTVLYISRISIRRSPFHPHTVSTRTYHQHELR